MMNALVDLFIYIVGIVIVTEHSHRVARIAIIVVAISLIISVLLWAAASKIG